MSWVTIAQAVLTFLLASAIAARLCPLRSILILGARAYTYRLKEPKSSKDRWLKAAIDRNGHSRAAIALANKNVRTAWAMVTQGTVYQRRGQLKVAA